MEGVERGSKIQRGAENESCKSRKSSGNIWCYFLGKVKNAIFTVKNAFSVKGGQKRHMRLFFSSKIKGRASKVFCQGYQAIVCSVEKTLLTLKLRRNIGAPWGGRAWFNKSRGGLKSKVVKLVKVV